MAKIAIKSTSCMGCIGIILAILTLWAIIFGVTVNGKHYGLTSCKTDGGVHIDTSDKK